MRPLFAALAAFTLSVGLTAQSPLNTISPFAANNSGAVGGGVYFDLVGGAIGIEITQFDVNFTAAIGTAVGLEVHVRAGTASGNERSSTGWTLAAVDTGGVVSAGTQGITSMPLTSPICVQAGAPMGFALVAIGSGHAYTNGASGGFGNTFANADLTLNAGSSNNTAFSSGVFSPRVVNTSVHYNLSPGCTSFLTFPPGLEAVAETIPGTGTLSTGDETFQDGDTLRWNYTDPTGSWTLNPAITVINIGSAGSAPLGVTAGLPGFNQLWSGSTPAGSNLIFGPLMVSFPDVSVVPPTGMFMPGDTVRLQGLVLDFNFINPIPAIPTTETIEYTHRAFCVHYAGFDSIPAGSNYPTGWANGGGILEWRVDANGTPSGGTGPSAAVSGSNYMYCETSGAIAAGTTYIMNTAVYASAGLATLDFQLSRVGAAIGTLEVRAGDGTGTFPTLLATYTGPDPGGAEWTAETLALAGLPANVQFQFHYVYGGSFTGDIAIDSFCLN